MPRVKLFDETEVLEKAISIFWKQGYAATSVQDLVTHLGINRASLYDTFGDKEKLFIKALEYYRKKNSEGVHRFLEHQPDVKKGIYCLFEMAIDESMNDLDKKGCFVANTTTELIPGDEYITSLLEENKAHFINLFYQYLKKGVDEGQINGNKDIKTLASLFVTLYNGLKVVSKIKPDREEMLGSVKTALSLLD